MGRLMLLRHAKSDKSGTMTDHDRPLADRGRRDAPLVGTYMAGEGLRPDLALVSTALRAQQTWALAGAAFAEPVRQHNDRRIYDGPASAILAMIRQLAPGPKTLVVVGHNPLLHQLALALAGTGDPQALARLTAGYPTTGLAVIDFEGNDWADVSEGLGRLERFETPGTIDLP
jgi:phosphohistidine phosphatase